MSSPRGWWNKNWFPVMIFVAVGMGLLFPRVGEPAGFWNPDFFVKVAVFVIFFLQGMVLPVKELARGILLWKFHTIVLGFNFILAPSLAWLLFASPWSPTDPSSIPGFLYLGILPTTVSSAVALTVAARGDSAAALFGVTLSNLAGIVMVPLGVVFWMHAGGEKVDMSFGDALLRVGKLIAIPMAIGQIFRLVLPRGVDWVKRKVGMLSQALIVGIVWILFAGSAAKGEWDQFTWIRLLWTFAGVVLYFVLFSGLFLIVIGKIRMSFGERVAAYFCGTQKGLATGAPMATAFFLAASEAGDLPPMGLILLPLMIYHPLQLTVGSFLAARFHGRSTHPTGEI
ncbi:bile acid:sodium symporter [Puniceicoccus vermicola]|uniref:Bile acid:sodium symporter n=1 Tax=Puniceicoccus vermicola TaxID=388746 RepID=A0A7X1E3E2_9BACT|nr:bile acid:sodium symporter [Puniceicoccus vermicola]